MTTREPSNLLNHRVSRARKLLSLPHGSRNRLAPGSFDLAKGEAEQTVNLDLTVISVSYTHLTLPTTPYV